VHRALHYRLHQNHAGNGYGQGGKYPALLVVKSLVNMQLVNNKNWEWKDKYENGEDFIRPGKEQKEPSRGRTINNSTLNDVLN
jgi:hypothetical protein